MAKIFWTLAVLCLFAYAGVIAQTEFEGIAQTEIEGDFDDGDVEGDGDDLPEDTTGIPGAGKHHGPDLDSVSDIFNCYYLKNHHHRGPKGGSHPQHHKHPAGHHVPLTPEEKKEIEDEIKDWKAENRASNHYQAFECVPKLKRVRRTTPAA